MRRAFLGCALSAALLLPALPVHAQDYGEQEGEIIDNTFTEEDAGEKPPFTVSSWRRMTEEGQRAYVRVTIEGLRWSPRYAACSRMTVDAMLEAVRFDVIGGEDHGPLLMHVASAAERLCS